MRPPAAITDALAPRFGAPHTVAPVSGGDINFAARLEFPAATLFVKWSDHPATGLYAAEAQGLQTLRQNSTFVVPEVIAQTDDFLALQWLQGAPPAPDFARTFAEKLVELHRAPVGENFGWHADNFLGFYPQRNLWDESWPRFYARQRLEPQIELARQHGLLPPQRHALLARVLENLDELCLGLEARPSLIHGDLWSGNYLALDADVALFDPAIYCAPREMELAYIELFGGFPPDFARIYREVWPLNQGYEKRRSLWQLYPLLLHLNAFGQTYGARLESACREILRR